MIGNGARLAISASHQAWRGNALVQNPYDSSNLLHATAVRTLAMTGADPDLTATSVLTLLHQQRTSGGWGAGGCSRQTC